MNGHACCIFEVCCAPRSEKQKRALAEEMAKALAGSNETYQSVASWVLENFDLAPVGTLSAFKAAIARLARENP